jgi:hypothetical protein
MGNSERYDNIEGSVAVVYSNDLKESSIGETYPNLIERKGAKNSK